MNGPGIDDKIRQSSDNADLYFLADHLASTTALTDSHGEVVEPITYDSFGNSSGSSLTRYDYTGRERDPDTGLMYYRARWYDPQSGRFISEDPIGFRGGDNPYGYVGNSPISFADPFGLARCEPEPPEPNLPQKMARCLALAKRIARALKELKRLEKNYDPVLDFEGGYPIRKTLPSGQVIDLGNSRPRGHYDGMMDNQRAVRRNWEDFKRECLDDNDDFRPPPVPADARKYAYKKWTPPHPPSGTPRTFWDELRPWLEPPPLPGRKPQPCWWCLPWPPPIPVWNW